MKRTSYKGQTVSLEITRKAVGRKMMTWLSNRGIVARFDSEDKEVWAPVTKHGHDWTRGVLDMARRNCE